jgi:hypothetical protein
VSITAKDDKLLLNGDDGTSQIESVILELAVVGRFVFKIFTQPSSWSKQ